MSELCYPPLSPAPPPFPAQKAPAGSFFLLSAAVGPHPGTSPFTDPREVHPGPWFSPEAQVQAVIGRHFHRLVGGAYDVGAVGRKVKVTWARQEACFVPRVPDGLDRPPPPPAVMSLALPPAHHLWYLQVRAPLTSSLMEPASLRSSNRITRGTSPVPVSRSIWLARLERYSCRP